MKKIYNSPMTTVVELKIQSPLMDLSIHDQNATTNAMGRDNDSDWDEE